MESRTSSTSDFFDDFAPTSVHPYCANRVFKRICERILKVVLLSRLRMDAELEHIDRACAACANGVVVRRFQMLARSQCFRTAIRVAVHGVGQAFSIFCTVGFRMPKREALASSV